ncbi:MAG: hypothetical protein LQ346_006983 [Caloplaca aetnensis]|nr:MAG: hypothetical protein LQ346_006983 [Caloplaca aetnensis]
MPVARFASAFRQSQGDVLGGWQANNLRKRKRGAEIIEESSIDQDRISSDEAASAKDSELKVPTTSRKTLAAGLRQQHYSVLTSLLHRCILEKDYRRAGRAWGMLLRTEVNGHPPDIRAHERWGIGAEILLHGPISPAVTEATQSSIQGDSIPRHVTPAILEGLAKAKDYYERLILQFPYQKTTPDATSSLTFYPVMFGIWIYSIQLRYRTAIQEAAQNQKSGDGEDSSDEANSDDKSSAPGVAKYQSDPEVALRETTVHDANEIAERLSELLISPPYSDHAGLWKIKGMLLLWVSHLLDHGTMPANPHAGSGDDNGRAAEHPVIDAQERRAAVSKAQEALSRALALGETLDTRTREEAVL